MDGREAGSLAMISPSMAPVSVHSQLPGPGQPPGPGPGGATAPAQTSLPGPRDRVLCQHCGRTASNGVSCEGICVADSGY